MDSTMSHKSFFETKTLPTLPEGQLRTLDYNCYLQGVKRLFGKKVTIVDLDTGVEQENMQYSYGLHQFLQLKHGNKISSESLKAIYVSNLGYFSRFEGKIFGISGTIGDEFARNLLRKLYNVDFFKMPRCRHKIIIKENPFICNTNDDFLNGILNSVANHTSSQPILLICENVKCANEIHDHLKKNLGPKGKNMISYVSSQDNSTTENTLEAGHIIISTNLAGRGTDFKIDEKCKPGLHVILTYLPSNKRVETQAFGRTSRAGNNGSTEFIVCRPQGIDFDDIDVYHKEMSRVERIRLQRFEKQEVPRIQLEEYFLKAFFENLNNLEQRMANSKDLKAKIRKLLCKSKSCVSKLVLKAITEIIKNLWALWLDDIQCQLQTIHIGNIDLNKRRLVNKFNAFWKQVENDVENGNICRTLSDHVKLAKAYEEDIDLENCAITLESGLSTEDNYNEICSYYLGVCYLKQDSKSKSIDKRIKARQALKNAKLKLEKREKELQETLAKAMLINQLTMGEQQSSTEANVSSFAEQIRNEIELLHFHIRGFLTPALGFTIAKNSFEGLLLVNREEKESEEIFEAVKNSGLLKGLRLSKKITNFSSLKFKDYTLTIFEASIKKILQAKLKDRNREFVEGDFKTVVINRKNFWKILSDEKFFENETPFKETEICYDEERFTKTFNELPGKEKTLGKILADNNMKIFEVKMLSDLKLDDANTEKVILQLETSGYLVTRKYFSGNIAQNILDRLKMNDKKLIGLPEPIEYLEPIIKCWIIEQDLVSGKQRIVKTVSTKSLHMLPHDNDLVASKDIIRMLIIEGVIKDYKVSWPTRENFGKEKARIHHLSKIFEKDSPNSKLYFHLESVFQKFHPNEKPECFSKYISDIKAELITSIGLIKTLENIKINKKYRNIIDLYYSREIPIEVFDLINEEFHRIPDIKEYGTWWCTGATYVLLLGVLQIGLGITLGLLTEGTSVNASMTLIAEGGKDIMFAIQSGLTGNFTWQTYAIQKACSAAACILTSGIAGFSGAELTTIVLMDTAQEVMNEVLCTVGRYTLQGVGTTLINVSIENTLDKVREHFLRKTRKAATLLLQSDKDYISAKKTLEDSLKRVYLASYKPRQVEDLLSYAKSQLGINEPSSVLQNEFSLTMNKVALFYTNKIIEKLSSALEKGLIEKSIELYSHLLKPTAQILGRIKDAIKTFALNYIDLLTKYYDTQAERLEIKKASKNENEISAYIQNKDATAFEMHIKKYLELVDEDVVNDGVQKFQNAVAMPHLKKIGAQFLDSRCDRMFEELQADYHTHMTDAVAETGYEMESFRFSEEKINSDISMLQTNQPDEALEDKWDSSLHCKLEEIEIEETFGKFVMMSEQTNDDTRLPPTFLLCEESRELLSEAENRGFTICRKFVF